MKFRTLVPEWIRTLLVGVLSLAILGAAAGKAAACPSGDPGTLPCISPVDQSYGNAGHASAKDPATPSLCCSMNHCVQAIEPIAPDIELAAVYAPRVRVPAIAPGLSPSARIFKPPRNIAAAA